MKEPALILAVVVTLTAAASSQLPAAEPKVEETVIGPVGAGGLYVVSQNDARIAYVGAKGTRTVVSVDGVEGPLLDELFNGSAAVISGAGPVLVHTANAGGKFNGTPSAVIFSEQGSSYAYIGRQGNEYVVVHNGKEVGRGPRNALSPQHSPLGLSPKGTFAFWGEMKTEGGRGQFRLIVNGKAEPWAGHQDLKPVFSPDDKRYAYTAGTVEDYKKQVLIVDGKVANYVGHSPQFTADSRILLTRSGGNVVLVEGRPQTYAGIGIEKVVPSTVGSRFAVIVRKRTVNHEGVGTLFLDGREVPGTEGAMDISFSPDGKRWALLCRNPEARTFFMVIDGRKGAEYQQIADPGFWTPDSAHVMYRISNSGRNFVVVDAEEFAVQSVSSLFRGPFVFAQGGRRYAFSSVDGSNRNFLAVIDGKNVLPPGYYPDGDSITFSANGERYAFVVGNIGRQGMVALMDNGKLVDNLAINSFILQPRGSRSTGYFQLSPDGKHLARMARGAGNTDAGLYVNEKLVYPTTQTVAFPTFTPDSKHLFWLAIEPVPDTPAGQPRLHQVLYVDGVPAARLSREGNFLSIAGTWSVDAKGVLTTIGIVGDAVKRLRITPPAEIDIDRMIARAGERREQAKAAAEAAQKKAEAEKLAAKQAAEAAAAKAKADQAARAEVAAKARKDALEARARARQLQIENAKRKRQGLPPLKELP